MTVRRIGIFVHMNTVKSIGTSDALKSFESTKKHIFTRLKMYETLERFVMMFRFVAGLRGTGSLKNVIAPDRLFKGNDRLKTNTVLQMKGSAIEFKTIKVCP